MRYFPRRAFFIEVSPVAHILWNFTWFTLLLPGLAGRGTFLHFYWLYFTLTDYTWLWLTFLHSDWLYLSGCWLYLDPSLHKTSKKVLAVLQGQPVTGIHHIQVSVCWAEVLNKTCVNNYQMIRDVTTWCWGNTQPSLRIVAPWAQGSILEPTMQFPSTDGPQLTALIRPDSPGYPSQLLGTLQGRFVGR